MLEKNVLDLKGSVQDPHLRFLYAFIISLLLALTANLLAGQDVVSSRHFNLSFEYFIYFSIIVFLFYLCVYLAIIKEKQIFKYPLLIVFLISLFAQYNFIIYGLSFLNHSITSLSNTINLFASLLSLISSALKIYCIYIIFAYKIYFWNSRSV